MLNGPSVFSNSSGSSDNVLVQLSAWIPFPLSWFLLFVNVSPYFSCLRLSPCLLILVILFLIRKFLKIERALCMASIWNPQHNLGTHDINKLVQYFFAMLIFQVKRLDSPAGHRLGTSARGVEEERRL